MTICLFEDAAVEHLYPLTRTRGPYNLRIGIRTLLEIIDETFEPERIVLHGRSQVARHVGRQLDLLTNRLPAGLDVLFINGRLLAKGEAVVSQINELTKSSSGAALMQDDSVVAAWVPDVSPERLPDEFVTPEAFDDLPVSETHDAILIHRLWHLLRHVSEAIETDFRLRTKGYNMLDHDRAIWDEGVHLINSEHIYLGEDVTVYPGTVLNAEEGPIYVDDEATIHEHAVIKGPTYIGPKCEVKVGANIHTSSFGYWCKVAGEMHDVIFQQLSNKAHPGFLGHSVLGSWCNIGAGSNNSNLRNDYGPVKLYDTPSESFEDTGEQYCGLFMGDHSKCSINTTFNTGTVVDVFCNLFGTGFHPKYMPPFSWGSPNRGYTSYRLDQALRVAEQVLSRRERRLEDEERDLLSTIHASWQDRERPA